MLDLKKVRYKYYWSGICYANIIFDEDAIYFEERDINRNIFKPKKPLDRAEFYWEMPFEEILKNHDLFNQAVWNNNDVVQLSQKYKYEKYITVEEGQYWANRKREFPLDIITVNEEIVAFIMTKREGCAVLVRDGYQHLTPLKDWKDDNIPKAKYNIFHYGTFMVEMRDGVKLCTDVWLPKEMEPGQKMPTILIRTPYGRQDFSSYEKRFVNRGYALVAQDVRGRHDSEGDWMPMYYEAEDGEDTLKWISEQRWSNEKVGMIGASYGGLVQWAASSTGTPYLEAMISIVTSGTSFIDFPKKNGILLSGVLPWSFAMAEKFTNFEAMNRKDWDEVLSHRPLCEIPKKFLGKDVNFINEWFKHEDYDDFWRHFDWNLHSHNYTTPSLLVSGWFDDVERGTSQMWEDAQGNLKENFKMILGPWLHSANTTRDYHDIAFDNNAIKYDIDLVYQKWFDKWLYDFDNRIDSTPKVEYYTLVENRWNFADSWPPKEVQMTPLYLDGEEANSVYGKGKLVFEQKKGLDRYDTYKADPLDPVPHLIDLTENELNVPENYKEVEKRKDILIYTSDILSEDIHIAGEIYAQLYASSSALDTDWVVRITDVDNDGNSYRVSDGIIRSRYRNSYEEHELLTPGKIEKYHIPMSKTAYKFKKGHQIRVQVTSSAYNLSFPNHNTGNKASTDTEFVIAEQKIYHSKNFPTCIFLPFLKI